MIVLEFSCNSSLVLGGGKCSFHLFYHHLGPPLLWLSFLGLLMSPLHLHADSRSARHVQTAWALSDLSCTDRWRAYQGLLNKFLGSLPIHFLLLFFLVHVPLSLLLLLTMLLGIGFVQVPLPIYQAFRRVEVASFHSLFLHS